MFGFLHILLFLFGFTPLLPICKYKSNIFSVLYSISSIITLQLIVWNIDTPTSFLYQHLHDIFILSTLIKILMKLMWILMYFTVFVNSHAKRNLHRKLIRQLSRLKSHSSAIHIFGVLGYFLTMIPFSCYLVWDFSKPGVVLSFVAGSLRSIAFMVPVLYQDHIICVILSEFRRIRSETEVIRMCAPLQDLVKMFQNIFANNIAMQIMTVAVVFIVVEFFIVNVMWLTNYRETQSACTIIFYITWMVPFFMVFVHFWNVSKLSNEVILVLI